MTLHLAKGMLLAQEKSGVFSTSKKNKALIQPEPIRLREAAAAAGVRDSDICSPGSIKHAGKEHTSESAQV